MTLASAVALVVVIAGAHGHNTPHQAARGGPVPSLSVAAATAAPHSPVHPTASESETQSPTQRAGAADRRSTESEFRSAQEPSPQPQVDAISPVVLSTLKDRLLSDLWGPGTGLVAAIVATVLGGLAYDRLKRRISVKIIHRPGGTTVSSIQNLYLHRIDPNDRISPHYVTHFLSTPDLAIKSVRQFKKLANSATIPPVMHVLIAAKCQGEVVGLLKALYVDSTRMLFIAYAAVQAGDSLVSQQALPKIFSCLQGLLAATARIEWITFELTRPETADAKARDRLFRHHAKAFGVDLRKVDIEYLQPDLDCLDTNAPGEEVSALLYLASMRGTGRNIDLATLRRLLLSILLEVYVPTWLIDHDPTDAQVLEKYVRDLADLMLQGAPATVALR